MTISIASPATGIYLERVGRSGDRPRGVGCRRLRSGGRCD